MERSVDPKAADDGHEKVRVPEITAYFWILKLLTTAMGESISDYLVNRIDPFVAVALGGICLVAALALQFSARRYVAWNYWLAVAMVAVFGTMFADALHKRLGIPYATTSVLFALVLAVVFFAWHKRERTLSIHSINKPRRELFYWATVLVTFALGTAAGDLTATTLGLGYLVAGVLFSVFICVPALAYWRFGLNEVFAFWFAYVLTRPIGASFSDWAGKSHSVGGLALGDGPVAGGLAIVVIGLVIYLTVTRKDVQRELASSGC